MADKKGVLASRGHGQFLPIIVILVAVAALAAGYFWGLSVAKKRAAQVQQTASPTPQAEVQVDTGYRNPFEGVDFNPFK